MKTIHQMATYIVSTMNSVSESVRPSQVEASFGLETNINVTLTWEFKKENLANSP
jgi:hypothetical protein